MKKNYVSILMVLAVIGLFLFTGASATVTWGNVQDRPQIPANASVHDLQSNFREIDPDDLNFIRGKPDIPAGASVQALQANWRNNDPASLGYIQGKPANFGSAYQGAYLTTDNTTQLHLTTGEYLKVGQFFYLVVNTLTSSITPSAIPANTTNFVRMDGSGGGLTEAQVLALIGANVSDWARTGNTEIIPQSKQEGPPVTYDLIMAWEPSYASVPVYTAFPPNMVTIDCGLRCEGSVPTDTTDGRWILMQLESTPDINSFVYGIGFNSFPIFTKSSATIHGLDYEFWYSTGQRASVATGRTFVVDREGFGVGN